MKDTIQSAFKLLDNKSHRGLVLLFFLMLGGAGLEVIGLGLFMPFVAVVADPTMVDRNSKLLALSHLLGNPDSSKFLLLLGGALIAVISLKSLYAILLSFLQSRFLFKQQITLESKLYETYLYMPYSRYVLRNPSELFHHVRYVSGVMANVILPSLVISTESIVMLFVFALLFAVQPWLTFCALVFGGAFVALFYGSVRSYIKKLGERQDRTGVEMVKWMNQGMGGLKEIRTLGREEFFLNKATEYMYAFGRDGFMGQFINQVPRPVLETVAFSALVGAVLIGARSGIQFQDTLPVLVLFAGAIIRILPSMSRVLGATVMIRQSHFIVKRVSEDLNELRPLMGKSTKTVSVRKKFQNEMIVRQLSYTYSGAKKTVLQDISFSLHPGEAIAFVGPSGAGKTTLVDILLGLLDTYEGQVLLDGCNLKERRPEWAGCFGYVPQSIYLSDDSIRRNVAFGLQDSEIDDAQVWRALKDAQLERFVKELPNSLDTRVGDRGVMLSGGQRQRIGIARAFYRDPDILVLDEATSSLDNETERDVSLAIESLQGRQTLIVIAHRLSTVAKCDRIYFLKDGKMIANGSLDSLLKNNLEFQKFSTMERHYKNEIL